MSAALHIGTRVWTCPKGRPFVSGACSPGHWPADWLWAGRVGGQAAEASAGARAALPLTSASPVRVPLRAALPWIR